MTDEAAAPLEVVDPHIHIWDLKTRLYPRREQRRDAGDASIGDYLVGDLLADASAVRLVKAVHIEAFPTDGLAEARHVQAVADAAQSGIPQGIVANADLARADVDEQLRQLAALPRVRGIRHALNRRDEKRDLLGEPDWRVGFVRLQRHGLSFDLQLSPQQTQAAAELALDNPGTPIVVNHAGWPVDRGFAGWRSWRTGLRVLAACGNVWIKISGLGMFDHHWTVESLRPYVFEVLDVFGVERAMFASNFPVDRAWSSYSAIWQAFAAIVADLPREQQVMLMRGNAEQFYRI